MTGRISVWCVWAILTTSVQAVDPAGPAPATQPAGLTVLNNDSYVRTFRVYKTPVVLGADGVLGTAKDIYAKQPTTLPEYESALPPPTWQAADFDDSVWDRRRSPIEHGPGSNLALNSLNAAALYQATTTAILCVRGKFFVEDPAAVRELVLSMRYVGGAAVFINGRELRREHLPSGELKADTLAEKYPDNLHVLSDGTYLLSTKTNAAAFEQRYRSIERLAVPPDFLQKGVNVLAVQVHRSPVNLAAVMARRPYRSGDTGLRSGGLWAYVGIRDIQLTAARDSAVRSETARPRGLQVWNCRVGDTLTRFDYESSCESLQPIRVTAPRNGVFSGRLAVSCDGPIRGLKATVSDLSAPGGGRIAASAVLVRCAEPCETGKTTAVTWDGRGVERYDGLRDELPTEIPVVKCPPPAESYPANPKGYLGFGYGYSTDGPIGFKRSALTCGAVAPLWFTIRVPTDAKPGVYEGVVSMSADGLAAVQTPLRLTVCDWTLPELKDRMVRNLGFMSEHSEAMYYKVPFWSEKHFEYLGKAMALMAEVGSRQALVNVGLNWYGGSNGPPESSNESIIHWIRKDDGTYTYDFGAFDKYLDVIARTMGQPLPLRLNCWGEASESKDPKDNTIKPTWRGGSGVSLKDAKTGAVSRLAVPAPDSPDVANFWKPVVEQALKKIEARGWLATTAIGHNSYCYPPKPSIVAMCRQLWPDAVWAYTAHNGLRAMTFKGPTPALNMFVRYSEAVWTEGPITHRGYRTLIKPHSDVWCGVARNQHYNASELVVLRDLAEHRIMRGEDGLGQLGVDFYPIKNPNGRGFFTCGNDRGGLGPDCSTMALLAPGPNGPIATERFESFREGVELCEAVLFLERALQEKKIDGELAARVDQYLDLRSQAILWNWHDGRAGRDEQLLRLAGEVAKAMGR